MEKYSKKFKTDGQDSPEKILDMFMQTAKEESDAKEEVQKFLKKNNLAWMIYKWKVDFLKEIKTGECIVRTWPSYFDKISIYREFTITENYNLIAKATSVFVIVDMEKRKLIELPNIVKENYHLINERNFIKIPRIVVKGQGFNEVDFEVTKDQIDSNNHVHNTYYLSWILDALPLNFKNKILKTFSITYMKEILYSDHVKIKPFVEGENVSFLIKTNNINAKCMCTFCD